MAITEPRPTPVATQARSYSGPAVMAFILSLTPLFAPHGATTAAITRIFDVLAVLLSVVLGIVALRRINKNGHDGRVLAIAGLTISGVNLAWFAVWAIAYL
jgi:hypothetical protein